MGRARAQGQVYDDLARAISAADLVIEVVPEELETKRKVFAELDRLAPRHALLATNSSSIPISQSKARLNVRRSASTSTSISQRSA